MNCLNTIVTFDLLFGGLYLSETRKKEKRQIQSLDFDLKKKTYENIVYIHPFILCCCICSLTDSLATSMAPGLATNAYLHVLDLSFNKLSANGVATLSSALLTNSALNELHLSGNQIDKHACELINEVNYCCHYLFFFKFKKKKEKNKSHEVDLKSHIFCYFFF